jgi:ligand-binding sensor domain-containing protein/signal transduction histidine kinase
MGYVTQQFCGEILGMNRLFQGAVIFLTGLCVYAAETPMLSQYVHRHWSMTEGLPQNSITDIIQDEEGFLWLATQEGLVRFDGFLFKTDSKLVPDQNFADVRGLYIDKAQQFWISLYRGFAYRDAQGKIHYASNDEALNAAKIRAVSQDGLGGLWLGSLDGQLFRLTNRQVRAFSFPGLTDIACFESYRETLWIGTEGQGLFVFEDGIFKRFGPEEGLRNSHINTLQLDHRGVLWIGTNEGIYSLANNKVSLAYSAPEEKQWERITFLLAGAGDLFWAGSQTGVMRLRRERGKLIREDTLALGEVTTLFEDQEGYLWVGTQGNGLHQLRIGTFKSISHKQGLPHNSTWALFNSEGETVFAATEADGLTKIEDGIAQAVSNPPEMLEQDVLSMSDDGEGGLWMGGFYGLFHYTNEQKLEKVSINNEESSYVFPVFRDRENRLLFGTLDGLYVLYPGEKKPIPFLKHGALTAEFLRDIVEDDSGRLWFATQKGLFSYWRDELKKFEPENSGLKKRSLNTLHIDREGRLWIAYEEGGIAFYDGQDFQSLLPDSGMWEPELYNLIDDGLGFLWGASNDGIFRVSKRELIDAMNQPPVVLDYQHFTEQHGLLTRECNFGGLPSVVSDGSGNLWFATLGGIAVVDPNKTRTYFKPAKLYLNQIVVDGVPIQSADEYELPTTFDELAIHYSVLDLVSAQSYNFRTRMEGLSEHWLNAGRQRVAYFTELPPGRFRFTVELEGVENVQPLVVRMKRQAPLWSQPWFSLVFPVIGFLVFMLVGIWWVHSRRSAVLETDFLGNQKENELLYIQNKVHQTEELIGKHLSTLAAGESSTAKLHNIGNVMNSFSVSASLIEKSLRASDLHRTIRKVIELIVANEKELGKFMSEDPRGPKAVQALADLGELREGNHEDLLQEVANLHMQCGHLKEILQVSSGQTNKGPESADLNILVEDALKIQSHSLRKYGIEVLHELAPLPSVRIPKSDMLQILVNLIKNAYEAIRMNETDNAQRIRLKTSLWRDEQLVVLEIEDTGVGISPEHRERLFSHGFTTKVDGHGFGLHYCHNIMEQLGGSIEAISEGENQGAMFRLKIPIQAVQSGRGSFKGQTL